MSDTEPDHEHLWRKVPVLIYRKYRRRNIPRPISAIMAVIALAAVIYYSIKPEPKCARFGCDNESVPGYHYCLDHGAGYDQW